MNTRKYRDDESPRVGDVVQLFDGAFGTGIITMVDVEKDCYLVQRVYLATHSFGGNSSQLQMGIERLERMNKANLVPYTTGRSRMIMNSDRPT